MFIINKDDNSIYLTRGDVVAFSVSAEGTRIEAEKEARTPFKFQAGDVLTMKVYAKKDCSDVVLSKDFGVKNAAEQFWIYLTEEDTKIGEVISKPKDYWYEVVLNEKTNPQTIIGYDNDTGAKVFKLFPEGADIPETPVKPEDIPVVDTALDMTSNRPVENRAIAKAFENLREGYESVFAAVEKVCVTPEMFGAIGDGEADDTEAVQTALDYAYKNNLYFRSYERHKITSQIVVKASCYIKSLVAELSEGFAVKICGECLNVEIGKLESNCGGVVITSLGETVDNVVYSTFKFGSIFANTIGLFVNKCKFYYNSVYYNLIQGLEKSIYILSSADNDFITESNFYGGLCGARYSNEKAEYALYVDVTGTSEIQKLKFFNFSPENSSKGMYISRCGDLCFYNVRFDEMGDNPVINIDGVWGTTLFHGGFVRLTQINIKNISTENRNRIVRFDNVRLVNKVGVQLRVKWLEFYETSAGLKLTFDRNAIYNYDAVIIQGSNNSITWEKIVNGGLPGGETTIGRFYRCNDCDIIFDGLLFNHRNISDFYLIQPELSESRTLKIGNDVIDLTTDNNFKVLHFMCKPATQPRSDDIPNILWYYEVLPWEATKIN